LTPNLERVRKIRNSLAAMLNGSYNDSQISDVAKLCHAFAAASINSKMASGSISEEFIGLKPRDIAFDCIADLFQRDGDGTVVQLKAYFDGVQLASISDEELLTHFRRLVFSKVNDGLFRMYHEVDPSLGKIIRNIKFIISTLHSFDELEKLGEHCICPSFVERLDELSTIDLETLERELRKYVKGTERMPELMAKLSLFLRQQSEHCRVVPLAAVARVFRAILSEPRREEVAEATMEDDVLMKDVERVIKEACFELRTKMKPRYSKGKNVPAKYIDYYFRVIEETLIERLSSHDGKSESLFMQLKDHFPGLKRNEYEKRHKKVLEYLLKLSTEEAKKKLSGVYP